MILRGGKLKGTSVGTGPIWLSKITCSGQEDFLTDCGYPGWGIHNCEHDKDVEITCGKPLNDFIKLIV